MHYTKLVSSAARTALIMGCASLSLPALAQDAAPADAAAASDEIVITAQKREQNVLDVPVAVSVVDQTVLDAAQVSDFSGLTNVSPSLTITASGNQNQNTVSLRGIGTFSFSTSVEPSVLVMVDEIPLLLPGQAFGNLTDVARIEVLRGPQGTLFGKSASAGVISITTEAPTSTFTGSAEVMATADEEYKVQAGLSGPIGPDGGFRLSGYYSDFGGYINNLETGNKLGQLETWGVRGKFDYRIGAVDLTLIADYGDSYGNGGVDTFRRLDQTGPGGTPVNTSYDLTGITPGPDNVDVRINDEQVNDSNQLLLAGKINVDLGFATLSSITSYQNWNYYIENDQDLTPSPSILQLSAYDVKSVTQELRLTSAPSEPFEYMVGLYYSDGGTDRTFVRLAPNVPPLRQNWASTGNSRSYAGFVQLGFDLSPSTKLSGGARINHEKIDVRFQDNRTATPTVFSGEDSETAFTWKAALQHDVSDNLMAFASIATGYKGQAYDVASGFDQRRADNPIRSESSMNYEIGIKGRAFDRRAQFQLVAFWTDYDDFQAQGINNEVVPQQFELTNVGKLRSRGVEFEASVNPTDGLTLFGSAAYIDARVREFPNAQCYYGQTVAEGCVLDTTSGQFRQDLAGKKLANSPDFKFNFGFKYEAPLTDSLELVTDGNYVWQSSVGSLNQNPRSVIDAYGIANASIGLQGKEGDWRVSVFVNNLFDQDYVTSLIDNTTTRDAPYIIYQQVPRNYKRYVGVRARIGF